MVVIDVYPKILSEENVILPDETLVNKIFEITYLGMASLFESATKRDEDYKIWHEAYEKRIQTGSTYILIFDESILKGYLAYKLRDGKQDINIEDLIILPKYHSDGRTLARLLCAFFKEIESSDLNLIRAHTNINNKRMQGILAKSGFSIDEFTESGIRYIIAKEQLVSRYSKIILYFNNRDKA